MKRSLIAIAVVCAALAFATVALADVNVFLDHSTATCPLGDNGPMDGNWGSNRCNPFYHASEYNTAPAGFRCTDNVTETYETCIKVSGIICCTYHYIIDNDERTMNNTCTTFTSPQTYTVN